MKRRIFAAAVAAALAAATYAGGASAAEEQKDAVIHFADMNGIKDWRPDKAADGDAILIQGRNGDWFRATFWGPCPEVRYAPSVGFVTDSLGNLDQFTSIVVEGHQCHFRTFERTGDPDERPDGVDVEERSKGRDKD